MSPEPLREDSGETTSASKLNVGVDSREDKLRGRTWSKAFREHRCLIPAAAFYEWTDGPAGKVPLRFERPGDEWLWIAGIWEQDKERGECFSMFTTEPNGVLAPVHDRMPAVLAPEQIGAYLAGHLGEFGPSAIGIEFKEAANFLKNRGGAEIPAKIQSAPPPLKLVSTFPLLRVHSKAPYPGQRLNCGLFRKIRGAAFLIGKACLAE